MQRSENGDPVGILETNNDISERKQAEEALRNAQAELAHVTRVSTLGELTASIAHEVNQPLAAIVTNGEVSLRWLDRAEPDMNEVRVAVGDMVGSARRASEVIQRLRRLYKRVEPRKEHLEIDKVVSEAVSLLQGELRSQGVSLRLEIPPALPQVSGDPVQLQQVVINLAVNGIDAMADIGDRQRELMVRARQEGVEIIVEVKNSGTGINPGDEERVFDTFFTTKFDGMGMGLSICRSIIEGHGGRLWASRNAGPGATFNFALPMHQGPDHDQG